MPGNTHDIVQSQFIRAGAGAGKTTKLISTFLDFVKEFRLVHNRFPRVVMTTFTRKATQEVKERLLVSALNAGEAEIFEYINRKSFVQISTIHGLLSIFLSQHADRLKYPQEIKVIDGQQYKLILKKQINSLLKKNPRYIEILEHYSFASLVDLSNSALDFKAQHSEFGYCSAKDLKGVVQARKSEITGMLRDILSLVPDIPKSWAGYFQFLELVLNDLQSDNEAAFRAHLEEEPKKPGWSEKKPTLDAVAHDLLLELRKKYFEKPFDSDSYIEKHEILNKLFFEFINELQEQITGYKRLSGELTIADLETLSVQLLEQYPASAIEFSNSWDYFMIDEYQDTSPLQVRILNKIVQNKPCFIVGDPQQSIYLFRGARSEVFDLKQKEMSAKKATIEFLQTNYRSEPTLMNFINSFFKEFSGQFEPMHTKPEASPAKALPTDAFYIKTEDQTQAVLQQIRFLISNGVRPQDICVLSRSNSKLTAVAQAAALNGIAVQQQASAGFEEKREILDLISFNKFLNNPYDDENLVMLLRSPWFYVTDAELLEFSQKKSNNSLWSALQASGHASLAELQKYLEIFDAEGSSQATRKFLTETSFVTYSAYYDRTGKREANIFKFLISLAEAEKNLGFSLGLFLEENFLSLQSDLGSSSGEAQPVVQPDCVSLMTVHASKGLQFKHVIVIGFADQPQVSDAQKLTLDDETQKFSLSVFDDESSKHQPSGWAIRFKEQLNTRELLEYDRVLYVALTRAIESLSLVFDTDTRSIKKSWVSRIAWPDAGTDGGNGYVFKSLEYNEVLAAEEAQQRPAVQARAKFKAPEQVSLQSSSVTELISNTGANAGSEVNYVKKIHDLKGAQRGTDLHRLFEAMKYVDKKDLAKRLKPEDQTLLSYLLVEQSELNFADLLKFGHNEWGFGLQTKTRILVGQIDLWCELDNEIHVLDYKTGSAANFEKGFRQLENYTLVLNATKAISQNKKIVLSVVFPNDKVIKKREYSDFESFKKGLQPEVLAEFT